MKATGKFVLAVSLAMFAIATTASASPWALSNSNGGDGFVTLTPSGFDLFGADNGVGPNYTTYTSTFASATTVTFQWSYITNDCCGSFWDPAGYVLNGVYTQLSTDDFVGGQINSSGVTSVAVNAGDTFGWYVFSQDSILGRGELDVVVPEPASMSLVVTGLLGFLASRRRKP